LVVQAQRKRGGIHHLELLLERFQVADFRVALCVGILFGIAVVNAIHFGGFENDITIHLVGAEGGGGVGGEIGIPSATAENDDAAFFEMANGAAANEWLGHFLHGNGGLDAGFHLLLFHGVLKGERIDDRPKHAHVIAGDAFDTAFGALDAAKNIAAA